MRGCVCMKVCEVCMCVYGVCMCMMCVWVCVCVYEVCMGVCMCVCVCVCVCSHVCTMKSIRAMVFIIAMPVPWCPS